MSSIAAERRTERDIMLACQRLMEDLAIIRDYLDVDADNLAYSKLILQDLQIAETSILQARITLKSICPTSINKPEII